MHTKNTAERDSSEILAFSSGAAGVYDIGMHYQYEDGRGVAELSTMKRAMGGFQKFASQSPAIILNTAAGREPLRDPKQTPHSDPSASHQQHANDSLQSQSHVSDSVPESRSACEHCLCSLPIGGSVHVD